MIKFSQVLDACVLRDGNTYAIEGNGGKLVLGVYTSGMSLPAGRLRAQVERTTTVDGMGWYVVKPGRFALFSNGRWFDEDLQQMPAGQEPIARVV